MQIRSMVAVPVLAALWMFAQFGPVSAQAPEKGKETALDSPSVVGTVEMVADGQAWVFDVWQGPPGEGYTTGYNTQPRGEALVLGASLDGRHRDSDAKLNLTVGVWRESAEHMCDPFANQVRFAPAEERATAKRLRPVGDPSDTCPPDDEGAGGLSVHLNLTEARFDEEAGTLYVAGTFSGSLGRADDAMQISEGRYEATLRSFQDLR